MNAELAEATAQHVTRPRLAWAQTMLGRAHERGEITADAAAVTSDLLVATLSWRLTHVRVGDDSSLDRLTGVLLDGVLAHA